MRIYAKDVNTMFMEVSRDSYVNQLWERKHNGLVKIITGVRRCGKSYLLKLFKQRLLNEGVAQDHIISIALDDFANESYLEPHRLYESVKEQAKDAQMHYVLLDEIQLVPHFENVLNGFLHLSNVDVYVTGSNSRFLSSDIITEFRGRGDELRVYPLSFAEFFSVYNGTVEQAWKEYQLYGGMPGLRNARLDFSQRDYGFIMENVIYNALCQSGWSVDVGMVEYDCKEDGKSVRKQLEVDFVCNKGSKRYYIQSSYKVNTEDKYRQEIQSFQHIHDSFQRILIQNEDIKSYYDENGIRHVGLFDFLLHPECIEN